MRQEAFNSPSIYAAERFRACRPRNSLCLTSVMPPARKSRLVAQELARHFGLGALEIVPEGYAVGKSPDPVTLGGEPTSTQSGPLPATTDNL